MAGGLGDTTSTIRNNQHTFPLLIQGALWEDHMRKTYTAPAILTNGSVVHETMSIEPGLTEPVGKKPAEGSIGFNL
jgi:hypothetical protein